MSANNAITVSVCMITYNHEKYIEEAINGVLMQEGNFNIELIIANDCSLDRTEGVILNIIKKHPKASIIKYFKHKQNLGMIPNFIFALNQCKGKYIALCDGDDYWIDSLKLQKQVNFLEANKKYKICGHSVSCTKYDFFLEKKLIYKKDRFFKLREVVLKNPVHTSSFCFLNDLDLNEFYHLKNIVGDYLVLVLLSQPTGIFVFEERMSVYRIGNQISEWDGKLSFERQKKIMNNTIERMLDSSIYSKKSKSYLKIKIGNKSLFNKFQCQYKILKEIINYLR